MSDAVQNAEGDVEGSNIGKRIILPSSFMGGAKYQHQLYQDAMAIVRRFGKPDFFITFTCNPGWREITDELLEKSQILTRYCELSVQVEVTFFFARSVLWAYTCSWQDGSLNLCD